MLYIMPYDGMGLVMYASDRVITALRLKLYQSETKYF